MNKIIFPGTFDPLTVGHIDLIERAQYLADHVIIAVGQSSHKDPMIPLSKRIELIEKTFEDNHRIQVLPLNGLLVDFAKANQAKAIVRGIRNSTDFNYEQQLCHMNRTASPQLETIFLMPSPNHIAIASSLVRDVIEGGGKVDLFVPPVFAEYLKNA